VTVEVKDQVHAQFACYMLLLGYKF